MHMAVIGGGYVGLVTATCFAEFGIEVRVVETHPERLATLQSGQIPIYEPGLQSMAAANVAAGRLSFGNSVNDAVAGAAAAFIAVGTPPDEDTGRADLTKVIEACLQIVHAATDYIVITTKSTVPVGTGKKLAKLAREARPDLDFDIASNPEFLREGSAICDFMRPDRVVIGLEASKPGGTSRAEEIMRRLYRPLYLIEAPILFTDLESAELIKYAANAFLAMKISFINEMADLCEKTGANVHAIARGVGLDGRIGTKFLHAGPGFGGSCFPKDTLALSHIARDAGVPSRLVDATIQINTERKNSMAERILEAIGHTRQRGCTIAILGLAFKPNTDDMRDAPSIPILHRLHEEGLTIKAFDPVSMSAAKPLLPADVIFGRDAIETATGADALVVLTEWNEFRALDPRTLRSIMHGNTIVDLRNIWDPQAMAKHGFRYQSVGRPTP